MRTFPEITVYFVRKVFVVGNESKSTFGVEAFISSENKWPSQHILSSIFHRKFILCFVSVVDTGASTEFWPEFIGRLALESAKAMENIQRN